MLHIDDSIVNDRREEGPIRCIHWEPIGHGPALACHYGAVLDGKLLVCGGQQKSGSGLAKSASGNMFVASLDIRSRKWTELDSSCHPRTRHGATSINIPSTGGPVSCLLVCGGSGESGSYLNDCWVFVVASNRWIKLESKEFGSMLSRRDARLLDLGSGSVMVVGGRPAPGLPRPLPHLVGTVSLSLQDCADAHADASLASHHQSASLFAWGWGGHAQLGLGDLNSRATPTCVKLPDGGILSVGAGGPWTIASTSDSVYLWGQGSGGDPAVACSPRKLACLAALRGSVTAIAVSTFFAIVVTNNGAPFLLGAMPGGLAADKSAKALRLKDAPANSDVFVVQAAAGSGHALLLTRSGLLFAYGSNSRGQLGNPDWVDDLTEARYIPHLVGERIVQVDCGALHSAAISKRGDVFVWGQNVACGFGDELDSQRPRMHFLDAGPVMRIACGSACTMALCSNGSVWAWGCGRGGRLGLGDDQDHPTPVPVPAFNRYHLKTLALGGSYGHCHGLALTREGAVLAWGSGMWGVVGEGGIGETERGGMCANAPFPRPLVGLEGLQVAGLSVGSMHAMCWTEGEEDAGASGVVDTSMGVFDRFPNEIICEIGSYLHAKSLARLRMTCKALHSILADDALWKGQYQRDVLTLERHSFQTINLLNLHVAPQSSWPEMYSDWANEQLRKRLEREADAKSRQKAKARKDAILAVVGAVDDATTSVVTWLGSLNPFKPTEIRTLFMGLDHSGKTTLLYMICLNEVVQTIPTIGFNVESFTHGRSTITFWDLGGGDRIRPLWRHYFGGTSVVVVCVNAADRTRMTTEPGAVGMRLSAEWELWDGCLLEDNLAGVPVLIVVTNLDRPNAMDVREIARSLRVNEIDRPWEMVASSYGDPAETTRVVCDAIIRLKDRGNGVVGQP